MKTIYKHEIKMNIKSLLIWSLRVGCMGLLCAVIYSSVESDITRIADSFSEMGAFSSALGIDKLSMATFIGYYSAEIGTIHCLGGAMFAAIIATGMLAKEEGGHTGEFLYTLPVSRFSATLCKWLAVVTDIVIFNIVCVAFYVAGFMIMREDIPQVFWLYHIMQVYMHIVFGAICFCISAFCKKVSLGAGLGLVLVMYCFDLVARTSPDIKKYIFISPFAAANSSELLGGDGIYTRGVLCSGIIMIIGLATAFSVYTKRDLAA